MELLSNISNLQTESSIEGIKGIDGLNELILACVIIFPIGAVVCCCYNVTRDIREKKAIVCSAIGFVWLCMLACFWGVFWYVTYDDIVNDRRNDQWIETICNLHNITTLNYTFCHKEYFGCQSYHNTSAELIQCDDLEVNMERDNVTNIPQMCRGESVCCEQDCTSGCSGSACWTSCICTNMDYQKYNIIEKIEILSSIFFIFFCNFYKITLIIINNF